MPLLLVLRFLSELGLLGAFAWGGWGLPENSALSVVLAVVLPAAAALVWGLWVAPKATSRLPDPARLGVEVTLFALAFVLVATAGPHPTSLVYGLVVWAAWLVSMPARRAEI